MIVINNPLVINMCLNLGVVIGMKLLRNNKILILMLGGKLWEYNFFSDKQCYYNLISYCFLTISYQ